MPFYCTLAITGGTSASAMGVLVHLFVFILNDLSHFVVSEAKLSDSFPGKVCKYGMRTEKLPQDFYKFAWYLDRFQQLKKGLLNTVEFCIL